MRTPTAGIAALQATIDPFRRALLTYDLPPATGIRPRSVAELRDDVSAISLLSRQARYLQLGHRLPALLEELQAAIAEASDSDRPGLYALLAQAYGGASALAHQLGYLDLRALTLDRIEWASRQSGDPLRIARTQWSRGASLLAAAAWPWMRSCVFTWPTPGGSARTSSCFEAPSSLVAQSHAPSLLSPGDAAPRQLARCPVRSQPGRYARLATPLRKA